MKNSLSCPKQLNVLNAEYIDFSVISVLDERHQNSLFLPDFYIFILVSPPHSCSGTVSWGHVELYFLSNLCRFFRHTFSSGLPQATALFILHS